MGEKELREAGETIGAQPEGEETRQGRPTGSRGSLPSLKTMIKRDLEREAGKSRKRIRELEQSLTDLQGAKAEREQVEAVMPPEMWAVFPVLTYDYLASRYGPHWRLKETEVKMYGEALEKVANRYLPDFAGNNPELTALALVAASTSMPRVLQTMTLRAKAEKEKRETPESLEKAEDQKES